MRRLEKLTWIVAAIVFAACGGDEPATMGLPATAGAPGAAGTLAAAAGVGAAGSGTAGVAAGSGAGVGTAGSTGAAGSGIAIAGRSGAGAGMAGAIGAAGGGAAGSSSGTAGGSAAGGSAAGSGAAGGGAGAPATGDCTREFLKSGVDKYFAALAAHDPNMLAKAPTARFTENAVEKQLGEGLLWKTAGPVKFTRSALDVERCGSVTEAVLPNSGTDTIFGIRLKHANQQVTEIETIVVNPDSGFFPTPAGITGSTGDAWEELVPEGQRATRAELEAMSEAYFKSFEDSSTPVPYNMPCDRLENGFKTTRGDCSNLGGAMGIKHPARRYPVSDIEAGITAGWVLFAGGLIDFHMVKVIDGKIRWINAVVGPSARTQGWE